jgi:hypothetical protein
MVFCKIAVLPVNPRSNPMAASLPISAAVDPAEGRGLKTTGENAVRRPERAAVDLRPSIPPVRLPLAFMLTGVASLLAGVIWLVIQPSVLALYHYNQSVIAVTHLFVLGCFCSIVMGAMYQLVPVALETTLYSQRLIKWHFALHVIGFAGMVWMFWRWDMKQVGHFGSALAAGAGLLVFNLARTLRRVPKWNVTATAVTAALGWISLAIILGLAVAAAKCAYESTTGLATAEGVRQVVGGLRAVAGFMAQFDAIATMHAHAHLGTVGFFTMLIVGVSYKLIPMFTLSELQSKRRAIASIALLNVGLLGLFVTILLRSPWKLAFALVLVMALILYATEIRAILRARKRNALDWGIKYFLTAIALLGPVAVLSLVLSWPGVPLNAFTGQLENLYGFLGLIGVVALAIMGMLYKIIPFLVWFGVYSPHVGRAQVPALADMYSPGWQALGYWSFLGGLLVAGGGIVLDNETVIRLGGGLLTVAAITLAVNVARMISHFVKPVLTPLPAGLRPQALT